MRQYATEALAVVRGFRSEVVLVHGDLHPGNILIQAGVVRFIDPYGLAGDWAYDVAFLAVHASNPSDALAALIAGYGRTSLTAREWIRWLAVYRLYNAMRNGLPTRAHFEQVLLELRSR